MSNGEMSQEFHEIHNFFELGEQRERKIKRFKILGIERDIKFKNMSQCENVFDILPNIFDAAIDEIIGEDETNEPQIGVSFYHPDLTDPILIPFRPRSNVTGQILVDQIERLVQSNAIVRLDDQNGTLKITKVSPPAGEGNHAQHNFYSIDELLNRKCVIRIKNDDDLCLARALVVAMTRPNRFEDKKKWNRIRYGETKRYTQQKDDAEALMKLAGLQHHNGPCGIPEIKAIQNVLTDYQIKIFSCDLGNKIMFQGIMFFDSLFSSIFWF